MCCSIRARKSGKCEVKHWRYHRHTNICVSCAFAPNAQYAMYWRLSLRYVIRERAGEKKKEAVSFEKHTNLCWKSRMVPTRNDKDKGTKENIVRKSYMLKLWKTMINGVVHIHEQQSAYEFHSFVLFVCLNVVLRRGMKRKKKKWNHQCIRFDFEVNLPPFRLSWKSTNRFEAFYEKSQHNVNMTESHQIVCVFVYFQCFEHNQ